MQQPQQNSVVDSVVGPDKVSKTQTIYDAGWGSIFWRNFWAGMARGLGNIVINLIFIGLIVGLMMQVMWPKVEPLLKGYTQVIESLQQMQGTTKTINPFEQNQ